MPIKSMSLQPSSLWVVVIPNHRLFEDSHHLSITSPALYLRHSCLYNTVAMSNISRAISSSLRPIVRASLASKPAQTRCLSFFACRQHEAQIRIQKDAIRQKIRDLETSRRRFSVSSCQRHGHLDKPKPGEEYAISHRDIRRKN